jgi:outer membrane protein assembly factor BamB
MLTLDSDEKYLYLIDGYNDSQSDRTFRIDWRTGAGAIVGNTGFNWNFRWLDFHPQTGVLYAGTDNQLYSINPDTGTATFLRNITTAPGTTQLGQVTAFAIRADGQAFIADLDNWGNNDFQLYSLNLSTGQASRVGTMFAGTLTTGAEDLTFSPDGKLYATRRTYPSIDNKLYQIDTTTGASTFLYSVGAESIGGPGVAFVTVPEPATGTFAIIATLVGATQRKRRRESRAALR